MGLKQFNFQCEDDRQQLLANNDGRGSREYGWQSIFFERVEKDHFETIEHSLSGHYLMVKLNSVAKADRRVDGTVRRESQNRGSAVYLPHNCPHQVSYTSPLGKLLLMTIPDWLVSGVAEEMGVSRFQGHPLFFKQNKLLLETALAIDDEIRNGNPHGPMFAEFYGKALAAQIICENTKSTRTDETPRSPLTAGQLRWLNEYIEANLPYRISVDDLARQVALSPFYFCRIFKAATGTSPHAYILEKRLEYARQLLQREEHSILDIALSSGFSDASNFSRQFKKSTGQTPSCYRRELTKQSTFIKGQSHYGPGLSLSSPPESSGID